MKTVSYNLLIIFTAVTAGIACSSWVHGIPLTWQSYVATLMFSPFVLTLGLPIEIIHGNVWVGFAAVAGCVGIMACVLCGGLTKKQIRWRTGIAFCAFLWSLGSAFTMVVWSGV